MARLLMSAAALATIALVFTGGCEDKEAKYDSGYGDGYAVGYNTACQIRATLITGDWSSESYSKGYSVGIVNGIIACNAKSKISN